MMMGVKRETDLAVAERRFKYVGCSESRAPTMLRRPRRDGRGRE